MNDNDAETSGAVTVIPAGAVEAMERASIDVQIATAHKYPRSLERFKETAMTMVTQDEDTAASCLYSRPVGDGKFAEGMSIRMAEIVSGAYGNLRVGAMLTEQTPRQVKARGFAHDLESNFAATSEVIESTVTRQGQPFSERMRVVVAKACLAKALRDATFKVVPRALCKCLEDAARKTAIGDAATLEKRRGMVMEWIGKLGIDKSRVFSALKVEGPADIGLKELEILTGLKTAIKEGDTSIEEAFPLVKPDGTPETGNKSEQLAEKLKSKRATEPAKEKEATAPTMPPEPTPPTPTEQPNAPQDGGPDGDNLPFGHEGDATPTPPAANLLTGKVEQVTVKDGKKKSGQAWKKYGVLINGEWYGTFDAEIGDAAQELENAEVVFSFKPDGEYFTLTSIAIKA